MNNAARKKTLIIVAAIFICSAAAFLAVRAVDSTTASQRPTGSIDGPKPKAQASSNDESSEDTVKHNAARVIRAQVIDSNAVKPKQESAVATSSSESRPSTNPSTRNSGTAAPAKRPPEVVIASFVEDDPTQVFPPDTVRYHAAVQSEAVDPDWAPATQAALQNYFEANLRNVDLIVADCRTDLCELQIVQSSNNSEDGYRNAIKSLHQQPWWPSLQLDQETETATWDEDRLVVIHYFSRK